MSEKLDYARAMLDGDTDYTKHAWQAALKHALAEVDRLTLEALTQRAASGYDIEK